MAGPYASKGKMATVSSSFKTLLTCLASATVAPEIIDFTISTSGAAADGVLEWKLWRLTADGTGTATTPRSTRGSPGIVAPIAAISTAKENYTIEPTLTAASELWDQGINQRAAYRIQNQQGFGFGCLAIASSGLAMSVLSTVSPAYTGQADVSWVFLE